MDWKDMLGDTTKGLREIKKVKPEIQKGFGALHNAVLDEGVLSVKHKELQAIAIAVAMRCNDCIGSHIVSAIKAGATREELVDTLGVAVLMGGGPAYMYAGHAIDAWDDLSD